MQGTWGAEDSHVLIALNSLRRHRRGRQDRSRPARPPNGRVHAGVRMPARACVYARVRVRVRVCARVLTHALVAGVCYVH